MDKLRVGLFDLAERGVNRYKLVAGNDPGEQNRHCLVVLAARMIDGDERAASNQLMALVRDGQVRLAAERSDAAHASRPSWAVGTRPSKMETNRGLIWNSVSLPSSLDPWAGTATIAAAG